MLNNTPKVIASESLDFQGHTARKKFTIELVENPQGCVINIRETNRAANVNSRVMVPANDPMEVEAFLSAFRRIAGKLNEKI